MPRTAAVQDVNRSDFTVAQTLLLPDERKLLSFASALGRNPSQSHEDRGPVIYATIMMSSYTFSQGAVVGCSSDGGLK